MGAGTRAAVRRRARAVPGCADRVPRTVTAAAPSRTSKLSRRIIVALTRRRKLGPDSPAIELPAPAWEASAQPDEADAASTRGLPRSCCRDDCRARPRRGGEGLHRAPGWASWSPSCSTRASASVASTASTLASSAVRRCTTSSPPWWQGGLPRRTPQRIGEPTSTTCTASSSMPRLESRTIATASPLRSPAQ